MGVHQFLAFPVQLLGKVVHRLTQLVGQLLLLIQSLLLVLLEQSLGVAVQVDDQLLRLLLRSGSAWHLLNCYLSPSLSRKSCNYLSLLARI